MPTPARHPEGFADAGPAADSTARLARPTQPDVIDPELRPAILSRETSPAPRRAQPTTPAAAPEPRRHTTNQPPPGPPRARSRLSGRNG